MSGLGRKGRAAWAVLVCCGIAGAALADAGSGHGASALHFSHPIVAESPSPDTKLRLDGLMADGSDAEGGQWSTLRLEGELAFAPWISLEIDVPYTFRDPDGEPNTDHLDTVEVGIKTASFAFAEHGVLVGGGLEVGLPTGSDSREIGSSRAVEIEPFVSFGWKQGAWEIVSFASAGVLHNERDDDAESEIGWNVSVLHALHPCVQLLLELDGEHVNGGEEDGASIVSLTPGIKVRPLRGEKLWIGLGVSVPLSDDEEFDARGTLSAFWHF